MSGAIESSILIIRSQRVILDADLARLYGTSTKRLNEQVRRNRHRFPEDFMFRLSNQEVECLRSQIATSKIPRGGRRYLPFVFTEHGAIMAANILNSRIAIDASIMLVRIFVQLRGLTTEHIDLKKRLQDLEQRLSRGLGQHENELQEIRFLITKLEAKLEIPPQKPREESVSIRRTQGYAEKRPFYGLSAHSLCVPQRTLW